MADGTKKMTATFDYDALVRAAAWLAGRGWGSALMFRREGERLEVCGSDGYVSVYGRISAQFDGWDDGLAVIIDDRDGIAALVRALATVRCYPSHVLEVEACRATYTVRGSDMVAKAMFEHVGTWPYGIDRIVKVAASEPRGASTMSSENLHIVSKLTKMLGYAQACWRVEPHGPDMPLIVKRAADSLVGESWADGLTIAAMPGREDFDEGW